MSRRWIVFAVFVVALSGVCLQLGLWQLDKLDQRLASNKVVSGHIGSDPVPIETVLDRESGPAVEDEWKRVTAVGTYDPANEVTVKYQTRDSKPGVDVVTPLVMASGDAVLVDRGWVEADNTTERPKSIPPPPPGEVTVTGWVRSDNGATGQPVQPEAGQVRAISSTGIQQSVPYRLYGGYLNLLDQQPGPSTPLEAEPAPDLGQGPHFFYGLQWFFFGGLGLFGWFYFAWAEAHPKRRSAPEQPG